MANYYCLELTVVSLLPMLVFHSPPPLSILYVEINAKEGAGLEMAVRVDKVLIAPATFMCRWHNKDGVKT